MKKQGVRLLIKKAWILIYKQKSSIFLKIELFNLYANNFIMHTYVYKIHNPLCIRLAFQHVDVLNIHACPKALLSDLCL